MSGPFTQGMSFLPSEPDPNPWDMDWAVDETPLPIPTLRGSQPVDDASDPFAAWYSDQAKRWNLAPDPDDPRHYYDYRGAFAAKAEPDAFGHWPSQFKKPGHPNQFVDIGGVLTDTITGQPARPEPLASDRKLNIQDTARAFVEGVATPAVAGLVEAGRDLKQTNDWLWGKKYDRPSVDPLVQPFTLDELQNNPALAGQKMIGNAFRFAPTAAGMLVGAGAAAATAPASGLAALGGSTAGAALATLGQTWGVNLDTAIKANPGNLDKAYEDAVWGTVVDTGFAAFGTLALGANPFSSTLKNAVLQTAVTQPAIGVAGSRGHQAVVGEEPQLSLVEEYLNMTGPSAVMAGAGAIIHPGAKITPARAAEPWSLPWKKDGDAFEIDADVERAIPEEGGADTGSQAAARQAAEAIRIPHVPAVKTRNPSASYSVEDMHAAKAEMDRAAKAQSEAAVEYFRQRGWELDRSEKSGLSESTYLRFKRVAGPINTSKKGQAKFFQENKSPSNPFGSHLDVRISGHHNSGGKTTPHLQWSINDTSEGNAARIGKFLDSMEEVAKAYPRGGLPAAKFQRGAAPAEPKPPRGLADLIPEARAERTEGAFTRQFVDEPQPKATKDLRSEPSATIGNFGDEVMRYKLLRDDDKLIGRVDFSELPDGSIRINQIVSAKERQGNAKRLVDALFEEFPDKQISVTDFTPKGEKFFRSRYDFDAETRRISPRNQDQPLYQRGDGATPADTKNIPATPQQIKQNEALINATFSAIKEIAPRAVGDARVYGKIAGGASRGAFWSHPKMGRLIGFALDSFEGANVAAPKTGRHEVMHWALDIPSLVKPAERQALWDHAVAEGWVPKHNIPERYADRGLTKNQFIEESIAEELSVGRPTRFAGYPKLVRKALLRIDALLTKTAIAAQGVMGKKVTGEQVMRLIETGEIGRRDIRMQHRQQRPFTVERRRIAGTAPRRSRDDREAVEDFMRGGISPF